MTSVEKADQVIFLGWAERAALVRDLGTQLLKWNVLGLKPVILVNFFPVRLNSWVMGFAIRLATDLKLDLRIKSADQTKEIGSINIKAAITAEPPHEVREPNILSVMDMPLGWAPTFFPLDGPPIIISEPGQYLVIRHKEDGPEDIIGEFVVALVEPIPLTPERIAAIKSNPNAAKAIRVEIGCTKCSSKLKAYAGLERLPKQEAEGYAWYQDIPDSFQCECGATNFDMTTMKRNLFAPIGQIRRDNEDLRYEPRYEESALDNLLTDFIRLLNKKPSEEVLQKFIEQNPILLHQFPAEKLFVKPPILTFFNADFAIVTPQKELILVEIEKAQTRLLKKDGGEAAELRHAFDQVTNWLHTVNEHFLAVLDSLGIERSTVSIVRGIVIAGRDQGYDREHLRRLKGVDRGRVHLLTYDDVASGLAAVIRRMESL